MSNLTEAAVERAYVAQKDIELALDEFEATLDELGLSCERHYNQEWGYPLISVYATIPRQVKFFGRTFQLRPRTLLLACFRVYGPASLASATEDLIHAGVARGVLTAQDLSEYLKRRGKQ